jgi:hypothetical protein
VPAERHGSFVRCVCFCWVGEGIPPYNDPTSFLPYPPQPKGKRRHAGLLFRDARARDAARGQCVVKRGGAPAPSALRACCRAHCRALRVGH